MLHSAIGVECHLRAIWHDEVSRVYTNHRGACVSAKGGYIVQTVLDRVDFKVVIPATAVGTFDVKSLKDQRHTSSGSDEASCIVRVIVGVVGALKTLAVQRAIAGIERKLSVCAPYQCGEEKHVPHITGSGAGWGRAVREKFLSPAPRASEETDDFP